MWWYHFEAISSSPFCQSTPKGCPVRRGWIPSSSPGSTCLADSPVELPGVELPRGGWGCCTTPSGPPSWKEGPPPQCADHRHYRLLLKEDGMLQNFLIVPKMVFSVCFLCSSAGKTEVYSICISFCLFTFYSFLDLEADWGWDTGGTKEQTT